MRDRLDKVLVDRRLAPSRDRARALILAGDVLVREERVTTAGARVEREAPIRLRRPDHPWASRGGLKLDAALDALGVDPAGRVCLDVGASTGGFTDVLLARGARRVYAVDVGYGLMDLRLRRDPRVVLRERTNARALDPTHVPEPCDLATIDVSFISLRLVLPRVPLVLRAGAPVVALVKPQFEAGRGGAPGGVVRDEALRRAAVDGVAAFARAEGYELRGRVDAAVRGPKGNQETFLHLRCAS